MRFMRDLGDDFKLSFRSVAEVYEAFGAMRDRAAVDKSIRFGRKRPTKAAVINAILLWVDALPVAEQKRLIGEGMARLNRLLAETDEERREVEARLAAAGLIAASDAPSSLSVQGRTVIDEAKAARRKRG